MLCKLLPPLFLMVIAIHSCRKADIKPYVNASTLTSATPYHQHYSIYWDEQTHSTSVQAVYRAGNYTGLPIHLDAVTTASANSITMHPWPDSFTYTYYIPSIVDVHLSLTKTSGTTIRNDYLFSTFSNFNFDTTLPAVFLRHAGIPISISGNAADGDYFTTYIEGRKLTDTTQATSIHKTLPGNSTSVLFTEQDLSTIAPGPVLIILAKTSNLKLAQPDATAGGGGSIIIRKVRECILQ